MVTYRKSRLGPLAGTRKSPVANLMLTEPIQMQNYSFGTELVSVVAPNTHTQNIHVVEDVIHRILTFISSRW